MDGLCTCECCDAEITPDNFYDRRCDACKEKEAHTDTCEGCGNKDVRYFDKEGFYVLCEGCYNAAISPGANHLDNLPFVKARYLKIVMPTKDDFESAYRQLVAPGTVISVDKVLNQLEANASRSGIVLAKDWRWHVLDEFIGQIQI